jgi:DNA-binding CsgD family transcriptional regulator
LNDEINQTNLKLSESNHIKEEYIAQFFDMCSSYIDKMEDIRKALLKKATNQQWDALREQLKSTQMEEREVQQLYVNFDRIFLNLYPTFVDEFNALLQEDEKIYPKKTELLNTELRIFALIRLGIDDSVKIASFLRYSLRTVYNYRTKVRNKAAGNRDAFKAAVCQIAVIDGPKM